MLAAEETGTGVRMSEQGELAREAILRAYDDMTFGEKMELNKLTNPLMNKLNQVSREGALEIIGKIGIVLASEKSQTVVK